MGMQKIAFNFLVRNNNGRYVKSSLCIKPPKAPINITGLRYVPSKPDTLDIAKAVSSPKGLDTTSEACRFFGVDSLENLNTKIINHGKLIDIMENKKEGIFSGFVTNLDEFEDKYFNMMKRDIKTGAYKSPCCYYVTPSFSSSYGCRGTKITFRGFDFQGQEWLHSIGLIQDYHGRLFILDSLGNQTKELQTFHRKIGEIIGKGNEQREMSKVIEVICNSKPQQLENELTCNNWTFANLEAVKETLNKGSIRSVEELEDILPRDINKILEEQMQIVKKSEQ